MTWDVIVVGARCAGSPLARFLARAGKGVLLVDASTFPSDQPLSTHFVQSYGMTVLDELGLGDRVRALAPPCVLHSHFYDHVRVRVRDAKGACCLRRVDLDSLLLEGAREAGAEIKLAHRVVEVVRAGGRVVGVVAQDRDGVKHELRASLVVGADGRNSTIGDLVGAEKYLRYEGPRAAYWGYWTRPAAFAEPPYDSSSYIAFFGNKVRFAFPVNRDHIMYGIGFPHSELDRYRADPRLAVEADMRRDPFFGKLLDGSEAVSKMIGILKPEYFFRAAAGPGWALVGDAGLHKDFTPGLGISDALRDARALAAAIIEGGDEALERYWRQRDVDSLELYFFARQLGDIDYNNPFNQLLYSKIATSAEHHRRIVEVLERKRSPYAVLRPVEVMRWVLGATLRGKLDVLKPFLQGAKRQAEAMKELERRRALLAAVRRSASTQQRAA